MKKIWIFTVGEPPLFNKDDRKHRSGILAEYLSSNYEITYWTSNFFHQKKTKFKAKDYKINKNLIFKAINTLGYKKNVSLKRLVDQIFFAFKIKKELSKVHNKPNLILVSMPTPELAFVVSRYANRNKIPVAVDVRDMWPEVMIYSKRNFIMKFFLKIIFYYMKILNFFTLKKSVSIISITNEFLEWSQKQTSKKRTKKLDRYFYLSLPKTNNIDLKVSLKDEKINICFYGIISFKKFDFDTLLKFCEKYKDSNKFKFNIYGFGDDEKILGNFSKKNNLLDFFGYADQNNITSISSLSDYGLAPYQSTFDFKKSIPNKIIEYLRYDLDIISCLEGCTNNFLRSNNIGKFYNYGELNSFENMMFSLEKNHKSLKFKKVYNSNFDYDKVYSRFENHLENLIK